MTENQIREAARAAQQEALMKIKARHGGTMRLDKFGRLHDEYHDALEQAARKQLARNAGIEAAWGKLRALNR